MEKPKNPLEQKKPADGTVKPPAEVGGRGGPDPVRYGDWEIKGKAVDF